jgi:hypothetical protein
LSLKDFLLLGQVLIGFFFSTCKRYTYLFNLENDILYKGYKGNADTPTKDTGLKNLMLNPFFHTHPGMFVALPLGLVIDPAFGIIAKLQSEGFVVEANTDWRLEASVLPQELEKDMPLAPVMAGG